MLTVTNNHFLGIPPLSARSRPLSDSTLLSHRLNPVESENDDGQGIANLCVLRGSVRPTSDRSIGLCATSTTAKIPSSCHRQMVPSCAYILTYAAICFPFPIYVPFVLHPDFCTAGGSEGPCDETTAGALENPTGPGFDAGKSTRIIRNGTRFRSGTGGG